MRLLFLVHGFPPAAWGGTEVYVRDLAQMLQHQFGDDVVVVTREANTQRNEWSVRWTREHGLRVAWINNTFRYCQGLEQTYCHPAIRNRIRQIVDDERPDAVHVHHLTCLSTDVLEDLRARRIPTLVTLNDYWLLCQRGQLLDLAYERCDGPTSDGCARCLHASSAEAARRIEHVRRLFDSADLFLAPSKTLQARFLAHGMPPGRIRLQEQGILVPPPMPRVGSSLLRLGFVGSLMISKAPHLLIEACASLLGRQVSITLAGPYAPYHGEDGYRERLEPSLSREGVEWLGPLPHEDIPAVLARIDVLVVPSVWIENAPFIIKEAFAAGVPVVASRLGGMAELVEEDRGGLLFEPGDADDLRRVIERLLNELGLLTRLRAAIPRVRSMSEDAAWTRALYRELSHEPRLSEAAS